MKEVSAMNINKLIFRNFKTLEDVSFEPGRVNVFIGANVTFTNDRYPRSKNEDWVLMKTIVHKGATIGAGSTILPGIEIGENAMVGSGSVVTKNIPAGEIWVGNPAKFLRKI